MLYRRTPSDGAAAGAGVRDDGAAASGVPSVSARSRYLEIMCEHLSTSTTDGHEDGPSQTNSGSIIFHEDPAFVNSQVALSEHSKKMERLCEDLLCETDGVIETHGANFLEHIAKETHRWGEILRNADVFCEPRQTYREFVEFKLQQYTKLRSDATTSALKMYSEARETIEWLENAEEESSDD